MSDPAIPRFTCPACARTNAWKQSLAGKNAKCACGQIITVPSFAPGVHAHMPAVASVGAATEQGLYAADPEPPPAKPLSRSVMAGIPYRKGLQPEPVAAPSKIPSEFRDVLLPIALIVAGLFATASDAMHGNAGNTIPLANVILPLSFNILIGLSLAVTAVLGGSMLAGIAFHGPMWQNILKLCSVALLPLALGSIVGRAVGGINGDIVSSLVAIGCYFALFWAVFTMAWSDRTVCVLLIWIIRSGVAYMIFRLTANGSPI
jgi:hypothetical protein